MVVSLVTALLPMSPLYAALLVVTTAFLIRYPFYRKSIGLIISITLTTIYGATLCLIMAPMGKRANINYYAGRFCSFVGTFLTGIQVEIEGAEHLEGERPRVVVANHQATLDILIMASIMPRNCVVIAKESLRYVPFLGTYMRLSRTIFINRGNHESATNALRKTADDIKASNLSVFVYPEGTRARLADATMLPFKKGAFHMAQQGQVPIVPVVFANYSHLYSGRKRFWINGVIRVKVLPPIHTAGLKTSDVDTLTQKTRTLMLESLKELSERKDQ